MNNKKYPSFLEVDVPPASPGTARFHIVPVPLEKSVSYGSGAAMGPVAILEASQQLEVFDGRGFPIDAGVYTAPAIDCERPVEIVLDELSDQVRNIAEKGKIPVILGGEHALTSAPVRALKDVYGRIGIVQIDAHGDLRDTYEGSIYSHASVMRRIVDMDLPLHQIGIRSLCREDLELRKTGKNITWLDAIEIWEKGIPECLLPEEFPELVFITFDIDALDASLMPATGTPEPGGLTWPQAMNILEKIGRERKIIGFDVVELAPIEGLHACNFTAARLVYNMMGIVDRH